MALEQAVWHPTGNPFVDMGQEMMAAMARVGHPEELDHKIIEPLLSRLSTIYFQPAWKKPMYSIFPNSPLTNPATKNREKTYLKLLQDWLNLAANPQGEVIEATACSACAKPAQVQLSRTLFPMTDAESGNFQSYNSAGIPFCGACALTIQFMPLGVAKVGGKFALPHFSDSLAQYNWSKWCWRQALMSETIEATGPLEAGTARSVNAFFALIERLLQEATDREMPDSSITLYLFTNYNQGPEVELHYLPTEVFRFIKQAMAPTLRNAWRQVVRRGYVYRSQKIDPESLDETEQLKKRNNQVYEALLNERSISGYFVDQRHRCPVGNWLLFQAYLKEVRGMDAQRLESLRDLGDRIAEIVRNKRKRLLALERANQKGAFVEQLYRLTKDAAATGQERPLITFEELIQDIFPHDPEKYESWREVKYLLLFRVYEVLFDELKDDADWKTNDEIEETEEVAA
ncbi:MAG: type I-B CRISPR-associated protein Cas8b1/Cst1 [Candidatus Bipolaricaulia bacterium]